MHYIFAIIIIIFIIILIIGQTFVHFRLNDLLVLSEFQPNLPTRFAYYLCTGIKLGSTDQKFNEAPK